MITTTNRNFTFFGLTQSTTYSLVLLTMNLGTTIGSGGSSRTTYSFTTLPTTPSIISFVASPNNNGIFGIGSTMTIIFDKSTNTPSSTIFGSLACSFSQSLTSTYNGVWTSSTTYVLTVSVAIGNEGPSIGSLTATFDSITTLDQLATSMTVTSPPLSGTWYSRNTSAPYLMVTSSSTTLTKDSSNVSLSVSVTLPTETSKAVYRIVCNIVEGSGTFSFSDSLLSSLLGGTTSLSSSNTQVTLTATPYTLGRLLSYVQLTPSSSFVGRVSVLTTLSSTTTSSTNTTIAASTLCTSVNYYNIIRVNTAPSVTTGRMSPVGIVVDTWTSITSLFGGITINDDDALLPSSLLRLQVLASSRAWL
jgi:hypothetical protein